MQKVFYCYLFGLWQSVAGALEFDGSITVSGQWIVNTRDGDSQSFNLTLLPELNADFDTGWQLTSIVRLRSEAIDGLQIDDINRSSYSDYSKPAVTTHSLLILIRQPKPFELR